MAPVSPADTAQGTDAIPPIIADAYRKAADAIAVSDPGCHLTWSVLAGIGQIESGQANGGQVTADGTTIHPILGPALNGQGYAAIKQSNGNWARAVGPMQFIPSTWAKWGADGNGDGRKDPNNIYDAALAAGHYLCASGGDLATSGGLNRAILAYNNSAQYLADVLTWISRYQHPGQAPADPPPVVQVAAPQTPDPTLQATVVSAALASAGDRPSAAGAAAIRYAVAQLGKPYVWGGAGPSTFDCSGLTSQAWAHAGVTIPRTSQDQWAQLQHIPLGQIRPGDLIVYFTDATHVALYLGDGKVIQAPRPGAVIDIVPLDNNPLLGAVRPDPDNPSLPNPTTPAPSQPAEPTKPPARPTLPPNPPVTPKPPIPAPAPVPLKAPGVASTQYPAVGTGAPAGTAGIFRLTAPTTDVSSFQYSLSHAFDTPAASPQTITPTSGGQATVTLTPPEAGTDTLYVRYSTKDGKTSPVTTYTFTVATPAARLTVLGDLTGDGLTDRVVLDTTGRLWLYPGRPGGTFASLPKELLRPAGDTTPTWGGVSRINILASTGPSTPPELETVEAGVTHRYTLTASDTLLARPAATG